MFWNHKSGPNYTPREDHDDLEKRYQDLVQRNQALADAIKEIRRGLAELGIDV